ncbi:hypothetical protein [Sphingomonas sp. Leaf62]|nr:hypothetical protein [Sphingomonas sp. Leaf62]
MTMDDLPTPVAEMTDAALRRAYLSTDGEPGDPVPDALIAEIERRCLDI